MDDPNYLKPSVAGQAREVFSRLLADGADVYAYGIELLSLFGSAVPDDAPGRLYAIWGELTDGWELHPERRAEAEDLMREAARDFLVLGAYEPPELDAYLSAWYERLGLAGGRS